MTFEPVCEGQSVEGPDIPHATLGVKEGPDNW